MRAGSRAAMLALGLPVLALGVETSRLAAAHPQVALGGGAPWEGLLQVGAGCAAALAGAALIFEHRVVASGLLLTLTGPAILLGQVPVPDVRSAVLFTVSLVGGTLAPALAATAAIACPVIRLRWPDRLAVAMSLSAAGLVLGLLPTLVFDPPAAGCFNCAANLAELYSSPRLYAALLHGGAFLTIAWGIGLAALVVWRWLRAPSIVRALHAPLILGGAAIGLLAAVAAWQAFTQGTPEVDNTARAIWLAQCGLVGLMAAGVAGIGLRARLLARKVSLAVLGPAPDQAALAAVLAACIGDPHLTLVFPREAAFVDAAGAPAGHAGNSAAVVRVTRADGPVAEVRYCARLAGAAPLLIAVVQAAGLVIEHLASQAQLQAELTELAASRQRIIAAGDAERRRLERDLHDGAQQRLIALQVSLQLASQHARTESAEAAALYLSSREAVSAALADLRDLAHGIHPSALADGGLTVGLLTLAESSRVPLLVEASGARRYDPDVEAAAYRFVAETVAAAAQAMTPAGVTALLTESSGSLTISLSTGLSENAGENVIDRVRDRIAALNGSVHAMPGADALTIEARIPCAS